MIYLYFFIHLRTQGNWLIIQQSPGFYFESQLAANQLALVFPVYPFPYKQASQVTPTSWTIKCTWFYFIICRRITTGKTSSESFRQISTVCRKLNEAFMVDLQGEKTILKPTEKKGEKCLDLETMNGLQTIQYSNCMSEKSSHMLELIQGCWTGFMWQPDRVESCNQS